MERHFAADELVIEINGPRCEAYDFQPLGMRRHLRPRISMEKLVGLRGKTLHASIRRPVPGIHLALDMKGRRGRVVDPLGWDQNKAHLAEINAGRKTVPGVEPIGPMPAEEHELNGAPRVATWLYHMRRAVESGMATVVQDSPKKHLTCGVEILEKIVPDWGKGKAVLGTTMRDAPQTIAEMKVFNAGDWNGFVLARGMRALAEAEREAGKAGPAEE